ncbi:MAG: flagellar motor switch protein FliM [Burkholderiales bacterium]|nr:flagellar motor switch protein FliM [Burkholderiales bacterium]
MSGEFLSQDEVDALLRGVTGEPEAAPAPAEPDAGGVRPYDLATQERIVRGRMPTLEIVNERFARGLRTGLFNFMRRSPDLSVGPVRVVKYGEFVRNLAVPTNLNIVLPRPLRGSALVVQEPGLVFAVIDSLFGGGGRLQTRIEGRDFTPTEMRIIQRLLEVALAEYEKAWAPVHPLRFEYVRSEMHTQFANVAAPSEIVVATTFTLDFGGAGGDLHVCLPYATLEPLRDQLYASTHTDQTEPDQRWMRLLARQVQSAEVEIRVELARSTLPLRRLLALKAGDVIPLDIPETVPALVDGVPILECRYGTLHGSYAIKVERFLAAAPEEKTQGAAHVH